MLMHSWYPEDPFIGLSTKLIANKPQFLEFIRSEYDLSTIDLEYKRMAQDVKYPEKVETCHQRFYTFYKTICQKYFDT
jgi:hypothetical protein